MAETNFSISVVSRNKPHIAIVTITRDAQTGLANCKINHTGYLFEDTLKEEIIPQDFFEGRKKVLFLAENSVVNIDRNTARRSTLITTCDAAVVHMSADQLDRDKCMKRLAITDKERCIEIMKALNIQTLLMGDELSGNTILIEDTPIVNAAATKTGAILHYRYAYVGQDYLDIQESKLPVYFDKNLTIFQNQIGAVLDQDTTDNLKQMF